VSIPTLLVCDGDAAQQNSLEGMIKGESGLRYIATVSKNDGPRAVEQAVKVGVKLLWLDLNDNTDDGFNLIATAKQLYPQLAIIISKAGLSPEIIKYSLNLGVLDCLEQQTAATQLQVVAMKLGGQASPTPAPVQAPYPAPTPMQTNPVQAPSSVPDSGSKWGNLDSIPTPNANAVKAQEMTGEIHLNHSQPVVEISQSQQLAGASPRPQATAPTASEPVTRANSWGDLDSIPAPGAGGNGTPVSTMQVQAAPAPAMPSPAPAMPSPAPVASSPTPAPAAPSEAQDGGSSKWGDLDAIPTPKLTQPAPPTFKPAGNSEPLSELDAIGTQPPLIPHDSNAIKGLRPSPEKAEMYSIGGMPTWMMILIVLIIFGAIGYFMMKPH
jgi:CheY-like chemotaxis protein